MTDTYWYAKSISIRKLNEQYIVIGIPQELGQFKGLVPKENSNLQSYIDWIEGRYKIKVEYVGVSDNKVHFKEIN